MGRSLDSRAVAAKLGRLERATQRLGLLAQVPYPLFENSWQMLDAAARNVEVAAQACVDVANHVIARGGLPAPSTAVDAIRTLAEEGVLAEDLAESVVVWVRLRNRLAHEYEQVTAVDLADALRDLEPLRRFAADIEDLLPPPGGTAAREPRTPYRPVTESTRRGGRAVAGGGGEPSPPARRAGVGRSGGEPSPPARRAGVGRSGGEPSPPAPRRRKKAR